MVNCKWCNEQFTWIEDCKQHEKYCAANTKAASLHIAQQAQPKITPHCGVCFWFPSATCVKCTEYSRFVEDPA